MSAPLLVAIAAIAAVATTGCNALLDVHDLEVAPVDAASADATDGGASEIGDTGGSCTDVLADPDNCGRCGHSCLGGECASGRCLPMLLANEGTSTLAVSPGADGYVFFTKDTAVVRMQKIGGGRTVLHDHVDGLAPTVLRATDARLFWIAAKPGSPSSPADRVFGVDAATGDNLSSIGPYGHLSDLALDDVAVYAANAGAPPYLVRAPLDLGSVTPIDAAFAKDQDPIALATCEGASDSLFAITASMGVFRVLKTGVTKSRVLSGSYETLACGDGRLFSSRAENIFWSSLDGTCGELTDCPARLVLPSVGVITAMHAEEGAVYWRTTASSILRSPTDPSLASATVVVPVDVDTFAFDTKAIYYSGKNKLYRLAK
ncbi:MAG: hypothetical protein ACXWP4_27405 [Polyangiales bacterium]